MLRPLILLPLFLSTAVNAVTVYISVQSQPLCTYPTGALSANASGGVGPYTYLWSTGATTAQIQDVPAGPYSVTVTDFNSDQATDNITLTSVSYTVGTLVGQSQGLCGSMGAMATTTWGMTMSSFIPPPPYLVDGTPMFEIPPDFITSFETHYVAFPVQPTSGYGEYYTLPFADGGGCAGTIEGYVGWPVEWPSIAVLDVQGSCSGGSNGSITLQTGLEGHQQATTVAIKTAAGQALQYFFAGVNVATNTASALAPGDYWLVQFMSTQPWFPSSGCGDSLLVTVPDLGNTCGNVSGMAFMDYNEDCVKQGPEPVVPGSLMEILPGPYYAITSSGGTYSLNLPLGDYTIEQQSATLDEHCTGAPIPFTLSSGAGLSNVNFPDTSLVPLDALLAMASGPARPGFPVAYALRVDNLTPASTGTITLSFDFDPILTYNSSSPAGTVTGNTITWTLPALGAFQSHTVAVSLQVPPDIALLGTALVASATVATSNTDVQPANNAVDHIVTVTGSYDPNEKVARTSSGESDSIYYIAEDEWIDYVLRFQNTGTDTAFNIVVTDTIGMELDLSTFVQGATSHPFTLDIREGHVLRFAFYNIHLPDSNVNEPASHGFVSFRIRPRQPLLPGTLVQNTANIFFDFNPPVITEPSVLTAEFSTGTQQARAEDGLRAFPNPADAVLHIVLPADAVGCRLLALDGRVVMPSIGRSMAAALNVGRLASGTYVVEAISATGRVQRILFNKQ